MQCTSDLLYETHMNTDELLEKIRAIMKEETVSKDEFNATRHALKAVLKAFEEWLIQKIETSQEETIDVLSKVIHKEFNMHEERMRAIEEQLDMPHKY